MNNNGNNNGNNNDGWNWWKIGAAAAGVGAAATLLYKLSSQTPSGTETTSKEDEETETFASQFSGVLENSLPKSEPMLDIIPQSSVPSWPHIINVNTLLSDIYNRYVAIKKDDFQKHYSVFHNVFIELNRKMKQVDRYYERFASDIKFAGSHFDGLRIKKPDEFDMDIVINMPVSMNSATNGEDDITIRQNFPGYVELVAGCQYQKLLFRDGPDCQIYRAAYMWMDDRKFILRNNFMNWFKSVGNKALNLFQTLNSKPAVNVNGIWYTIRTSESGPAWTIIIEDFNNTFRLDVDLVPALKFPESRWPVGKQYRDIPYECKRDYWMVVPKPNKSGNTVQDEHRSWRIALQDQEKQLLYNTYALRKTICLIKKLRDSLGMKKIASYYIKTIFFWEIIELKRTDPWFWQKKDIDTLFTYAVKKFYAALERGEIKYFWNPQLNLIANLGQSTLYEYKNKIRNVIEVLEQPNRQLRAVAKFLLTNEEYMEYNKFLS